MEKTVINVLLSTYNGERYLREQLDSVLSQENVEVRLYIRDDGSKDNTIQIIQEYLNRFSNIYLYQEQNIGCIKSFLRLIDIVNSDKSHGNYYAFCDQDDVWDTNKLWSAVSLMNQQKVSNTPLLYCSNLRIVDSELNFIRLMHDADIEPSKGRALVHNICTGCTMVINQKLIDTYLSLAVPQNMIMHDWFFYNLAIYTGNVCFDKTPHIQYRQHSNNVLGANKTSLLSKGRNFIHSIIHNDNEHYREMQAKTFYKMLQMHITGKDLNHLKLVAFYRNNILSRFKLILSRQICGSDINLRIRILLGLI